MFATIFYNPIYNLLIFFLNFSWMDAGIAIILTTILIKIILYPLFKKQIKTQIALKKMKPELDDLKKKYEGKTDKENKQKMAFETMDLYKKYQMNPFISFFVLIIQIPIILAMYWVFYSGGLPEVNTEILYSFISIPENIIMNFLGFVDLTKSSIVLAIIAGVSQYVHFHISMPDVKLKDFKNISGDFKKDMATSFSANIKYGLPVFIFLLLAFWLHAAIALYWISSNLFMIMQEHLVRKEKQEIRNINI